ncbi:chorismate lyase [Alteromonas pelagimontana]|uniref:Probable chorismate pyruvate-lyase n=1 Tax=Alteromonas pelagimontana TaxID=1858656 RepID=A0A6M4MCY3_9ALTE|nr:chorismate lyase [Alteromonas pelagimontana]QJR81041.1 chorismate lyase [Alteromonas pelagimontana]
MELPYEFPVGLDVNWTPASEAEIHDPYLRNWLLDTGSLTERLQSMCRRFSLVKLGQGTVALHKSESKRLEVADERGWQVREVVLCGDDKPWVFARSVIPNSLISGELANLGSSPLGSRLFNDARFTRSEFEVCHFAADTLPRLPLFASSQPLWGRRSCFRLEGISMMVAELFLADAPAYQAGFRHGK